MASLLEIPHGVPLGELLRPLEPDASRLSWSILELEATGDLSSRGGMLGFEERVYASPRGVQLTWPELNELAQQLVQVINGVLVGYAAGTPAPERMAPAQLRETCELVLEAHDSTVWWLSARDDAVVQRVMNALPQATLTPATGHPQ